MKRIFLGTFLIAALAMTSCNSASPDQPPANTAPAEGSPPAQAATLNACNLLTAEEVKAVIGKNEGGQPQIGDQREVGGCVWENPDTRHSITVSIGAPGTAASGKLDLDPILGPWEAGPDGIWFASGNRADFLVKDRSGEIQVVTSVTDKSDRATAVRLIGLIRSRV